MGEITLNRQKPFGTLQGANTAVPGAVYEQGGRYFNPSGIEVVAPAPTAPPSEVIVGGRRYALINDAVGAIPEDNYGVKLRELIPDEVVAEETQPDDPGEPQYEEPAAESTIIDEEIPEEGPVQEEPEPITRKQIMAQLDSLGIKYNKNARRSQLLDILDEAMVKEDGN